VTRDLVPSGLGYADLRLLAVSMRQTLVPLLNALPDLELEARTRAEEWLFQLGLLGAMRYVAQRERVFQEQAAQLEVRQLEDQLLELKAAFEEKTRLLDLVRQASTPIAPVHDGILVVPLVGVFDAFRAQLLTETLLAGVVKARAQVVILDISGVPVFDAEAADHIVRTARAVRLLGTRLILVGLSPIIASTIIELGVDLSGLTTLSTLQDGLARALTLLKLEIVPMARPSKPGAPRTGSEASRTSGRDPSPNAGRDLSQNSGRDPSRLGRGR
jgi:anti-anti-sigma regulatory factor